MICSISNPGRKLKGTVHLTASKSESNRVLIIRALCRQHFDIADLASAQDTQTLDHALRTITSGTGSPESEINTGPAGTTMRFLTAYLAAQPGIRILTGSERMKQRPIGILVEALRKLGASIEYLEKEGCPPLQIEGKELSGGKISIEGSVSSQFISALLLIAPTLKNGIELHLEGEIASRPYIEMTLRVMERFGIAYEWKNDVIKIAQQDYNYPLDRAYEIEADWSAASYYYSMAALAGDVDLTITGLQKNSLQGDSVVADIYKRFGVRTELVKNGIRLTKGELSNEPFNYSFESCPDIAQTVAVTVAALKIPSLLEGLHTLQLKETDRIKALQSELVKMSVMVEATPQSLFINAMQDLDLSPAIITYEDHRMAMAFAPLAMLGEIKITEPGVVKKSYPGFWDDLRALGFMIKEG